MLLLLPNLLGEELSHELFLPQAALQAAGSIQGLIAESEKGARRFLRRFSISTIPIKFLNEHTSFSEMQDLLKPLLKGEKWGLISDCGLPCIADPGSKLVSAARARGITIEAFSGPSSLTQALMLSGLPSQSFAFHGYLEKEKEALIKQIKMLEQRSLKEQAVQVCIEAPYRNQKLLELFIATLSQNTLLSIAADLTLPSRQVITQPISSWKTSPLPNLHKRPTVFLFVHLPTPREDLKKAYFQAKRDKGQKEASKEWDL